MKRDSNQSQLGDVIKDLLKIYKMEDKYNEVEVANAWSDLMGNAIMRKTRELRFRNGQLMVRLDSGVIKEEFSMAKEKIIDLMNEKLGKNIITELYIK
ncbi:DUF721 domain-containing protein [Halocola ammonii]|jgi:predicted nucleic acid-binding Zn ribbon protein